MIATVTMIVVACTLSGTPCVRYVEPGVRAASCIRTAVEQQWTPSGNVSARIYCQLEGKDI